MKLAALVTLYHPDKQVIDNIKTYIDDCDKLYIFDNTEEPTHVWDYLSEWKEKISYTSFEINNGISYPLNLGLEYAQRDGYSYLLTMDQDSRFEDTMLEQYKAMIEAYEKNHHNVAMYALNWNPDYEVVPQDIQYVHHAITSGSVLPIPIAIRLGGFDERLFIDEVDKEYCYRARCSGLFIVKFPHIDMKHTIGNPLQWKKGKLHCKSDNHNALRKYYIVRNRIDVMKRYPEIRKEYLIWFLKFPIKMLLLENHKAKKILFSIRGFRDGLLGRMGKYGRK